MKELTLSYNLFDLPTAQHKAGLAGLLVMIETMRRRGLAPLPVIQETTATSATITFNKETMQSLFDDLFDAEVVEVQVKAKWQGKPPKREESISVNVEGKEKKEKRFVYDVLRPKGLFLQTLYPDGEGGWIQIWRNMLWNILRAQPAARKVYEERAERRPSSQSDKVYHGLKKALAKSAKGKQQSESLAGTVFIGAQDKNAELVSFSGTPMENLLLHFWHIAALLFIPRSFSVERSQERNTAIKWQDYGFAITIPEVSHLEYFVADLMDILQQLDAKMAGTRPASSLIDLSEEGGLEYLYHLVKHRIDRHSLHDSVSAVEIYHVQKQGNNVRMLAAERLQPDEVLLNRYEKVRANRMNPIFKSFYLRNLLQSERWYENSTFPLSTYPAELLVHKTGKTPFNFPFLGRDARRKFTNIQEELKHMEADEMQTEKGRDDLLARRVYDLVRHYVRIKAEGRSGKKLDTFPKDEKGHIISYPQEYREAVEKVCLDAFLAMRGRREQDFVEYFTGSLCSVPQFLPPDDYLLLSQTLIADWERVKSLAMLAISANSYLSQPKTEQGA
ncbi:MAG: type I-MYXAN CRISPR-associated protein Cmx8 [Thermodesulfobacteriota bacterium]